ncbi:MAG: phosphorylase [Pseudolabrys sp.]
MIVVVGLAFEARIAAGPGMNVICAGDGRELAATIARAITQDCKGLISFGVAGGLHPGLKPGACVVASEVMAGSNRIATCNQWSQKLLQTIPNVIHGMVLGVPALVSDPRAKLALYAKTGAVALDMESHIVAKLAAARGLPMAVIRVVTDPAQHAIPKAALAAVRSDGTIDALAATRSLLKRPSDIVQLMRLALDTRAARATLRQSRRLLGPGLGLPEFRVPEIAPHSHQNLGGSWRVTGANVDLRPLAATVTPLQGAE